MKMAAVKAEARPVVAQERRRVWMEWTEVCPERGSPEGEGELAHLEVEVCPQRRSPIWETLCPLWCGGCPLVQTHHLNQELGSLGGTQGTGHSGRWVQSYEPLFHLANQQHIRRDSHSDFLKECFWEEEGAELQLENFGLKLIQNLALILRNPLQEPHHIWHI